MFRRMNGEKEGGAGETSVDKTKNILYVLIIATAITFLAPFILGIDPGTQQATETAQDANMGTKIKNLSANIGVGVNIVLDWLKYGLLAGAVGVIVVMRTGRRR